MSRTYKDNRKEQKHFLFLITPIIPLILACWCKLTLKVGYLTLTATFLLVTKSSNKDMHYCCCCYCRKINTKIS